MRIGIIGAGRIGSTLARLAVDAGHEVAMANSRGPATLLALRAELGPNAHARTVEQTAEFAELAVLAIPFFAYAGLPADALSGKVVADATNYYADRDGTIEGLDGAVTSSELVGERLPGARLVKAFNTIHFMDLAQAGNTALAELERRALFVASDDDAAKELVMSFIRDIGFTPVDTGSLAEGGARQQPGTSLYNVALTGREALAAVAAV